MEEKDNSKESEQVEIVDEKPQTLNIHSAAIHIQHKVGLKQRQAWFYMLYKAFPFLEKQRTFYINTSELKKAINYTSKNNEHLKDILEELVTTPVRWNLFNKDKEIVWGVSGLLAYCEITNKTGVCEYQFSDKLQYRFLNPSMYAKLNLLISKRFTSKHSLALYCLALDYLNVKNNYGEKNLTVEELRQYLGIKEDKYTRVVDIYRRILKKAEMDITKDSDMHLEIIPIRTAKDKITGFKLKMNIKKEHLKFYNSAKNLSLNEPNKQIDFFDQLETNEVEVKKSQKTLIEIQDKQLKKFFAKYQISFTTETFQEKLKEAQELFGTDSFESYLLYLSKYAESEYKKGTIKSFAGFFVSLFKDDTQIENYLHEIEQEQKKIESKRIKVESMLDSKVKERYENAMSNDFEEFLVDNIESLESKFIEIVNKNITTGFAREYFINGQNKGIVDKTLILNHKRHIRLPLMSELKKFQKEFGYKKPTFDAWKQKTINTSYLNQLRLEIEKEL